MSARFSTSPALRLPIAESRICTRWQWAFIATLFLSLALLPGRGYPWLAVVLGVPFAALVPALKRQPMVGRVLHWRRGSWSLEIDGVRVPVRLHRSSRASPLGVYLCWSRPGAGLERTWLFADSAPADELRRLRVRLNLDNPAQG